MGRTINKIITMKIGHFITSIDVSTGGPARSVTHLIESLFKNSNYTIDLFTANSNNPIIKKFKKEKGKIHFIENKEVAKKLSNKENSYRLLHGHGIWQMKVHKMSKYARKNNIPYLITPRGMLEPWSLSQGRLKKKLALKLFQYKDIKEAACIHATAEMEAQNIRKLGFKNPIAVIPNGINVSEFPLQDFYKKKENRKLLFLSRIHPKKGIENLINAWELIDNEIKQNWIVEIVGNGDKEYIQNLKDNIESKGLGKKIRVKQPVFGQEKIDLYADADLFVLPTFSENFGIVIAEALASFTPVITTKGTPWEDLKIANAGWWIDIGVNPLKKALEDAFQKTDEALFEMGKNGRELIEKKYAMDAVATKMASLYDWILKDTEKPDFVQEWKEK